MEIIKKIEILKDKAYCKMLGFGSGRFLSDDKYNEYKRYERIYMYLLQRYTNTINSDGLIVLPCYETIEYRNFYFADIFVLKYKDRFFGYKYVDADTGISGKIWYRIIFDQNKEDQIELPDGCHFGEDCIYCHKYSDAEKVCKSIYNIPELMEIVERFTKDFSFKKK